MNPTIKSCTIQGGAEVFGSTRRGRSKANGASRKRGGADDVPPEPPSLLHGGGATQQVMTAGVLPLGVRTAYVHGYQAPTMPGHGAQSLQGAPLIQGEINPAKGLRGGSAMPIPAIAASPVPPVSEVPRSVPHNLKVEQASFHFDNKNPINGGGGQSRKVELRKSQGNRKVLLNPKKYTTSTAASPSKTRKSRKITIGLSTLHRRVTRARKIREQVKEIPLTDLRKELIKRGLIKESSKAPESILRQIAADAQIVAGKGL